MAASAGTLGTLIQTNVNSKMSALSGVSPLAQSNPAFFIEMCNAIATGIASATTISFTTTDTGVTGVPPVPGTGTGVGIVVDAAFFAEDFYTRARNSIISAFGSTSHDAFPPSANNSGEFLLALTEGVAEAVETHFTTAWTLTSAHPLVYSGTGSIDAGNFSGLVSSSIESAIVAAAPNLLGSYWPDLAKAAAESYVDTIHNNSTGTVTIVGVCVPSMSQVCGVPGAGTGTGAAT